VQEARVRSPSAWRIRRGRRIRGRKWLHTSMISRDVGQTIRYRSKCSWLDRIDCIPMETDISSLAALISEPREVGFWLPSSMGAVSRRPNWRSALELLQTASSHLAKLTEGQLLQVVRRAVIAIIGLPMPGWRICWNRWRDSLPEMNPTVRDEKPDSDCSHLL